MSRQIPSVEIQGYLAGDAFSLVPVGKLGGISVLSVGTPVGTSLSFAFRNNTGSDVVELSGTVSAQRANGEVIAVGRIYRGIPDYLQELGIGWAEAIFDTEGLPAETVYVFDLDAIPVSETTHGGYSLTILQTVRNTNTIQGMLQNDHEVEVSRGQLHLACFREDGSIASVITPDTLLNPLQPGQSYTFEIDAGKNCPKFLLTGDGAGTASFADTLGPVSGPLQIPRDSTASPDSTGTASPDPNSTPNLEATVAALQTQVAGLQDSTLPTSTPTSTPYVRPTPTVASVEPLTISESFYLQSMYQVVNSIFTGFILLSQGGQVNIISASAQWHAALITALNTSVPSRMGEIHETLIKSTSYFDKAATAIDNAYISGSELPDSFNDNINNGMLALFNLDDQISELSVDSGDDLPSVIPE